MDRKKFFSVILMTMTVIGLHISSAQAEGSRDLVEIDSSLISSDTLSQYPAYRPYLDWRDRTQFDMPSENVVYAYANQGETVYFGTSVAQASDRSIEAVVQTDVGFTTTLDLTGKAMQGSSIAVTLPTYDGSDYAFDPNGKGNEIYADGSTISEGDSSKVYLFKVDNETKAGYIESTAMEANGPNIEGSAPDGYKPLSFVAPITGTYAFRFLSPTYGTSDVEIISTLPTVAPENEAVILIDFAGSNKTFTVGTFGKKNESYYEKGLGTINLYNGTGRGNTVNEWSADQTVTDADTGSSYTYKSGSRYLRSGQTALENEGSVEFTPVHPGAAVEIVWEPNVNGERRDIIIKQGDNSVTKSFPSGGQHITRIDNINGSAIKSGVPLKLYISRGGYIIYEIRYIYDKTVSARLAPTKVQTIDFSGFTAYTSGNGNTSGNDERITDSVLGAVTLYSKSGRGYKLAKNLTGDDVLTYNGTSYKSRIGLYAQLYSNGETGFGDTLNADGTATTITHSAVGFVAKHNNASVQIIWTRGSATVNADLYAWSAGTEYALGEITKGGLNEYPETALLKGLKKDEPVYIYSKHGYPRIYSIKYICPDADYEVDGLASVSETTVWNSFADVNISETQLLGGYDTIRGYANEADQIFYDTNNSALKINGVAGFDPATGTPVSKVLEIYPQESGSVEVSFSGGVANERKLVIAQDGVVKGYKVRSVGGATTDTATAFVDADKPVYIYSDYVDGKGGNVYIHSITYTPRSLQRLARRIDEPWSNSASEVAAWDITVANSGANNWDIPTLFSDVTENTTKQGIKFYPGGSAHATEDLNGTSGMKVEPIVYNSNGSIQKNVFEFTPSASGTVRINAWRNSGNQLRRAVIEQEGVKIADTELGNKVLTTVTATVSAGKTVSVYANPECVYSDTGETKKATGGVMFASIEFIPDEGQSGIIFTHEGRVWADILFLNAGNYQTSLYSNVNVLTKDGFLYNINMNGIQPYSYIFYANNRGYLYDRWSLSSDPSWPSYGVENTTDYLQPLERSFYSRGNSDVGPAPQYDDLRADGVRVTYKGKELSSSILPNYIPTAKDKDYTHKIFFNAPEYETIGATTGNSYLRGDPKNPLPIQDDLFAENGIAYSGMGSSADNSGEVAYGTEGIGGRFDITLSRIKNTDGLWWTTALLYGIENVSLSLDFSEYLLDSDNKPVLDSDGTWKKVSSDAEITDAMRHNVITLTATLNDEEPIESDSEPEGQHYMLVWNGRDSYGNIVPQGAYVNNLCDCTMMGVAHFPILDAEHNPNGIKMQLANTASVTENGVTYDPFEEQRDLVYYNNSAVSPKLNVDNADTSSWLYTGYDDAAKYPSRIADGLNRSAGVSSNYSDSSAAGAMAFGDYDGTDSTARAALANVNEAGYGNFTALDLWIKYHIDYAKEFVIGVNQVVDQRDYAYVSYVAANAAKAPAATAAPTYTTVYQFGKGNGAADIYYEKATGTVSYASTQNGSFAPDIQVDAASGKLKNDNRTDQWAQFNKGTVLIIKDAPAGTSLTFVLYGDSKVEIGGNEYGNGETYTSSSAGDIVITAVSDNSYIATITMTAKAFADPNAEPTPTPMPLEHSHVGLWDWNLGVLEFQKYNTENYGRTVYGSTISTGFIATTAVSTTNSESDYINWTITIPAGSGETKTYIKDGGFGSTSGADEETLDFLNSLLGSVQWAAEPEYFEDEVPETIDDIAAMENAADTMAADDAIDMTDSSNDEYDVGWILDEIALLSDAGDGTEITHSLNANVGDAVITDDSVRINSGAIYPVESFGAEKASEIQIKLRYRLPSVQMTDVNIVAGLVIDNIYAPEAYVMTSGGVVTGLTEGSYNEFENGTDGTVTATSYEQYANDPANPYYVED